MFVSKGVMHREIVFRGIKSNIQAIPQGPFKTRDMGGKKTSDDAMCGADRNLYNMVRVKLSRGVNRNTTVSEHHTPGPFTRGVNELTSPCDRKRRKE